MPSAKKKNVAGSDTIVDAEPRDRSTVYKGFYIYADQYVRLIELSARNKINGVIPNSSSDIIREALDEYLADKC